MRLADTEQIRRLMNEYAGKRKPFLCVLNFEMTEGYFIENPLKQTEVLFRMPGATNKPSLPYRSKSGTWKTFPISAELYKQKFTKVHNGLNRGDSFLVNLTVKTELQTSLSLQDIFFSVSAPYELYLSGHFVCFSPECFVRIRKGVISTYPMKGTIDASVPDARRIILKDPKETAEHHTIVDLLRNDLSMNAREVRVACFRYIDTIRTQDKDLFQVSSEITGILPPGYHNTLGDIVFRMLPAGSVSGAPKPSTLRIIREAEEEPRGYYTGILGYFDGIDFDSAVLIRFIEEDAGKLFFRSGGGITAASNPESEYQEVLHKVYLPLQS